MLRTILEAAVVVLFFLAATAAATFVHESSHADICVRTGGVAVTAYAAFPPEGATSCAPARAAALHDINEIIGMAVLGTITATTLFLLLGVSHRDRQRLSASSKKSSRSSSKARNPLS